MSVKGRWRHVLLVGGLWLVGVQTSEAAARVFVSVTGNDANVCSDINTPCRTLGGGVTQVDAQGEVIVIDSGSYAGATVTKSVKINVAVGVVAFSASPIVSNPGAGGVVVVRGVTLKALTPGTDTGLVVSSGTLFLENGVVDGWATGVLMSSNERLFLKDSTIRNCAGAGVQVQAAASVSADNTRLENNGSGLIQQAGKATLTRSLASGNGTGVHAAGAGAEVTLHLCHVSNNGDGIKAASAGVARVGDSTVSGNVTGLNNAASTLETFGTNQVRGNTTDMLGTISVVSLQ